MKKVFSIVLSRILGILIFLILLAIANSLSFNNPTYSLSVNFLNQNIWIILLFSLLFFFAELSEVFIFPFNIIYPWFNAFASVFLIEFLKRIFVLTGIIYPFDLLQSILTPIVFLIVLIVGYVRIVLSFRKKPKEKKHKGKLKEILEETNEFFNRLHRIIMRK